MRTNRFLYHVSYSSNRESIFKKGLIGCPKKINGFTKFYQKEYCDDCNDNNVELKVDVKSKKN